MLKGMEGDMNGNYESPQILEAIQNYEDLWLEFMRLKETNPDCATLYEPYSFYFEYPDYHRSAGMDSSVYQYEKLLETHLK